MAWLLRLPSLTSKVSRAAPSRLGHRAEDPGDLARRHGSAQALVHVPGLDEGLGPGLRGGATGKGSEPAVAEEHQRALGGRVEDRRKLLQGHGMGIGKGDGPAVQGLDATQQGGSSLVQ